MFDDGQTAKAQQEDNTDTGLSLEVIPRDGHSISRRQISENALKVLYRLHKSGFNAYLVGGGVRDLLLGLEPKDFDVVTNATPEEIKKLFRNCRLVGRRFRLAISSLAGMLLKWLPSAATTATAKRRFPRSIQPDDCCATMFMVT